MMKRAEINSTYEQIIHALDKKEVKTAFDKLQGLIAGTGEYAFQDRLDEIQDTYKYMLRYRIEGMKDPMEEQIYHKLIASTYELSDQVRDKASIVDSPTVFYTRKRLLQKETTTCDRFHRTLHEASSLKRTTSTEAIRKQQQMIEEATVSLFSKIWTSVYLTQEEATAIQMILNDQDLPVFVHCQIVSALMMGLQAAFDQEKLRLLFDAADIQEGHIRYRALIGILLTLYKYKNRIYLYPKVADRLAALSERFPHFTQALQTIIFRFILSQETEKITRKLQNEIIPAMIKLGSKTNQKTNLKDINLEWLEDEMNPEWEKIFSDSQFEKRIHEFGELQKEGADVLHATFTHLKNYPFFREISNWFMPFTPEYSAFIEHPDQEQAEINSLEYLSRTTFMCNSDKYSLGLSMMQLPRQRSLMMMRQLGSEANQMLQHLPQELLNAPHSEKVIISHYIQDLYRFFKLFPQHGEFYDIFEGGIDFHNLPILQPYLSDPDCLMAIAEYYLRKHYLSDALTIYNRLSEMDQENDILFQKVGYCKDLEGDVRGALEAFLRADILRPDSPWVIRKIASCYRFLKQPDKALTYFHRCETLKPEDLSIQIFIGHCHLDLKNYSEALKYYYKVDYLDPKSGKVWRPIAWCSFLLGKYDQAHKYYQKIMDNQSPNTQDYLNAGHTEWALQNMRRAVAYYREALMKELDDFESFLEFFEQDIPNLLTAGIEEAEIPIMLDQVRYALQDEW